MAKGAAATGPFLSAAVLISAASSAVGGTDYTAHAVDVWDRESVAVQMSGVGVAAAASGAVSFKFYASLNGTDFDTTPYASRAMTLNGSEAVRTTSQLSVRGIHSIKCNRIANADASNNASSVNVRWGKTYGG